MKPPSLPRRGVGVRWGWGTGALLRGPASVDHQLAAGHERGLVRGEIEDAVGDLVGGSATSRAGCATPCARTPRGRPAPLGHRRQDRPGGAPSCSGCARARTEAPSASSRAARPPGRLVLRAAVVHPDQPSWEEMLMMEPPPAWRIAGIAALVPRNTPLALTSITRSHSSAVVSSSRPAPPTPALFTRMSEPAEAADGSNHNALPVELAGDVRQDEDSLAAFGLGLGANHGGLHDSNTSPMTTRAPSWTNRRASTAPMPREPPLMSADLFASLMPAPHS